MGRPDTKYAAFTWKDLYEIVISWSADYRATTVIQLVVDPRVPEGGFVEAIAYERLATGRGAELVRTRHPFPCLRPTGQPGAIAYAVFSMFAELENNPWLWSEEKRRSLRGSNE